MTEAENLVICQNIVKIEGTVEGSKILGTITIGHMDQEFEIWPESENSFQTEIRKFFNPTSECIIVVIAFTRLKEC